MESITISIIKEAYVSFEVAKLLKEKGFDWDIRQYYALDSKTNVWELEYDDNQGNYNIYGENLISAPTQQMACRWLREVHKIDISVTPDDGSWWIKVTELESWSGVFNGKVLNSDDTSTKESCYEAALEYVLTNLI